MGNDLNRQEGNRRRGDEQPKKKAPPPPPPRVGRKKKNKGIEAAAKLPSGTFRLIKSHTYHEMQTQAAQIRKDKGLSSHGGGVHRVLSEKCRGQARIIERVIQENRAIKRAPDECRHFGRVCRLKPRNYIVCDRSIVLCPDPIIRG